MKQIKGLRLVFAALAIIGSFCSTQASAQMPARFYLKNLDGGNGVPLIFNSISGNTNPFDSSHLVTPNADIDATLAMAGYAHTFSLFDRSAMAAVIFPMGRISGNVGAVGQKASGFGDPMLEFDINLIGPRSQKNIPDALRYEPGFSLDLLADLVLPIGDYNNKQLLNIGMNRWYGRFGMPMTMQLGPWVPGRRTTLELLPSVWIFGDNKDFVGQTLKTKPKYQLDAHLTRDFTQNLWGSVDATWYSGGQSSINGVKGSKLNVVGVGLTLGYTINDNLNLTVGYKSTINDSAPDKMKMDAFMVSLVFGWHPLIEGFKRLKSE